MKSSLMKPLSSIAVLDANTLWLLTIRKLPSGKFRGFKRGCQPSRKENSFKDVNISSGKIPFCLKSVRIKLFDVVFLAKKPMTSSWLATMVPPVDITVLTTQQEKSSILDSFGPQSTKMPMSWLKTATHANARKIFYNVMKMHKIPSKFEKSLTSGAFDFMWPFPSIQSNKYILDA
ncbi:hypothetical protein Tco_1080770 [Tanacetum coccineum]|uniref:Uncharacterized protein n=1 Tax=Tanacetum coccineum TaxID=301880 RepID=A0ABQ5HW49_9ASTR